MGVTKKKSKGKATTKNKGDLNPMLPGGCPPPRSTKKKAAKKKARKK